MMIRRVRAMLVVAVALIASLNANAATKTKTGTTTASDAAYNFRCVGPALDLKLDSFSLPISRAAASATSGAAAKPPTSSLTIEIPASKAYSTLYAQVIKGDHYSSCTLVETVTVPVGEAGKSNTTVFTWTFSQVTPTTVTAIWKEASSTGSAGADHPAAQIRVTLTYSEIRFDDGSGSTTKAATDSWTATQ